MTEEAEAAPTVAVVGGGAVGVTAAHDLAARGADVTLYERGELAAESSGRAAGVLYDAYAEDVDAAVSARALERFRAFDRSLPGFSFSACPYVIAVREGDPDADAVPAMVERMCEHGREVSVVDPAALGERFPSLRTDDLAVTAVAEGAGWTDPPRYVRAVGERAAREGAAIETETAVALGPRTDAGREIRIRNAADEEEEDATTETRAFDAVVVAAGAHTRSLLGDAGVSVPVVPYRVQALVAGESYDGPMVYDATADAYLRPHPDGLLAGDGTEPVPADPDGYRREADDWFREDVAAVLDDRLDRGDAPDRGDAAERVDLGSDETRAWAGLCTATPDGDPLVGPVDRGEEAVPTLFVAAGWQGHGFMRAPATGETVAEGVLASLAGVAFDAPESPWIGAFDPGRFDGDEAFEIAEGMSLSNRTDGE